MPRGRILPCTECGTPSRRRQELHGARLCFDCYLALAKDYESPNPSRLRRVYGIDSKVHGAMYARQAGRCAICDKRDDLVVDHDHETGEVRGLLCSPCNLALGLFKDDLLALTKAMSYLLNPPGRSVKP